MFVVLLHTVFYTYHKGLPLATAYRQLAGSSIIIIRQDTCFVLRATLCTFDDPPGVRTVNGVLNNLAFGMLVCGRHVCRFFCEIIGASTPCSPQPSAVSSSRRADVCELRRRFVASA